MNNTAIAVAWTGASGIHYGIRLLEELLKTDRQVYLLYSQAAQIVAQMETELVLPSRASEAQAMLCEKYGVTDKQLQVFGRQQWTAPPASGSNPPEAMVICPCTSGTLATVAHGVCDDLIDQVWIDGAGTKSEKRNADHHKGQMVPLRDGKHPSEQYFKSQSGKRYQENSD